MYSVISPPLPNSIQFNSTHNTGLMIQFCHTVSETKRKLKSLPKKKKKATFVFQFINLNIPFC